MATVTPRPVALVNALLRLISLKLGCVWYQEAAAVGAAIQHPECGLEGRVVEEFNSKERPPLAGICGMPLRGILSSNRLPSPSGSAMRSCAAPWTPLVRLLLLAFAGLVAMMLV